MPDIQKDNTAVKQPLHPEDYPDLIGPPRPRQMDTGFITTDYSNPIQRAAQKYSAAYLNSNFANSAFMDVLRWFPGLHTFEKILTAQPVSEEEQISFMMPVKFGKGIEVSKPYVRVAPSDGRQQMAVNYYFKDRPKSYFQVIKDTEPNNYSIHFKTNRGDYSSQEVQDLINKIVADLPENANIATWGTVSKGGFSGLNRFQVAGMQPTGQFRRLSFKDPSIADEIAAKYGVTLNADGTVNWPILTKNYTGFTPREDFTISATPVATRSTGRTNYSLLERPSRISTAEKAGVPRGERNQPKVETTWRQGDDAVKMFRDYGGIEAQEGSPLMEQIKLYIPEARERYGLVGNTNISDTEIAQSLYKRALQLSGMNNGAVYATGEPLILFRGDTRRFHTLRPRMSPDELATKRGTMDNALGNLFLGEYPNNWVGNDRYMGTIRNFNGDFSWADSGTGSKILSKFVDLDPMEYVTKENPRLLYHGTVGRRQTPISVYKAPASAMESGVNDLNAFIVKSPSVRDATSEISVLNDDLLAQGFKGTTPHMRTKLIYDETGFPLYLHPDGSTTPALAGYDNRIGMAEHYNYVLNDAKNKGQGLLMSKPNAVLRDEHSGYTYYALPNFNIRNAKHLLGYDLTQPIEKSWAIYRKQGGKL